MAIIIKLQGLPLEATSIDVRRYFLGLKIPDGGVHIVGGVDGTVFIEFASDEDARQAMARGDGSIKNSSIKLLLSSRAEMQTVVEAARAQQQQYLKQQQQHLQQHQQQTQQHHHQQQPQQQLLHQHQQQPSPFIDPRILSQNYQSMIPSLSQPAPQPFLPPTQVFNQFPPTTIATSNAALGLNLLGNVGLGGNLNSLPPALGLSPAVTGTGWPEAGGGPMGPASIGNNGNLPIRPTGSRNSPDNRSRMSSMRGGDDKLFANKRCVLAASNIPYRATSKDIIEFLSEFNIKEDCIRRRYNQKGQPTADAKIAFATPDAAMKALKMMNKKTLCGRPVFLKPV